MVIKDNRMFGVVTKKLRPHDVAVMECMFDEIADSDHAAIEEEIQKIKLQKKVFVLSTTAFPLYLIWSFLRYGFAGVRAHLIVQKEMWRYLRTPISELTRTVYEHEFNVP